MADESSLPNPFALTASRQGTGSRTGDQDEQNRRKADFVSKLSKVKAPEHPLHTVIALINANPLRRCKQV
jgi:hypothetical protein